MIATSLLLHSTVDGRGAWIVASVMHTDGTTVTQGARQMVGLFFMRRAIRHDYGSPMFAMAGFGLMCVGIGE